MAQVTRIFIAAAAALAVATACSAGDSGADNGGADTAAEPGAAEHSDAGEAAAPDSEGTNGEDRSSPETTQDGTLVTAALQVAPERHIVHTVSMSIETDEVAGAAAQAASIAVTAGGFVADETTRGDDAADLTLKIPVEAHADALGDLEALGEVRHRTRTAEDVTDQVVDTASRIDSQRASIARTRDLLESATDLDQIIQIESELSSRESDLDALLRRQEELSAMSTLATIQIGFTAPDEVDEPAQDAAGFLGGLRGGWDAFVGALGVAAMILGAALPFVVLVAVFGLPVLWWRRRNRQVPALSGPDAPSV